MATSKRVSDEPAFVLHRYDWSESSLILDVFTRHHGRIALVAKGAKRPSSNFRPILLPLQPLGVTYSISPGAESEIHTLKSAEWMGGYVMPTGDALLSGYHINELLIRLLARDDPHAALFDAYSTVVSIIASEHGEVLEAALRAFEMILLREIGVLPSFDVQTLTMKPIDPKAQYVLVPEGGLRAANSSDRVSLRGDQWASLQRALDDEAPLTATLAASAPLASELKTQLRSLLHYHCGVTTLRTRQMMIDLQSL